MLLSRILSLLYNVDQRDQGAVGNETSHHPYNSSHCEATAFPVRSCPLPRACAPVWPTYGISKTTTFTHLGLAWADVCSEMRTCCMSRMSTKHRQLTTNNQQPTTNDQQPPATDQQPTTNDRQSTLSECRPRQ